MAFMINHSGKIYLCNGSPPKNGKPDKIFLVVEFYWVEFECIPTSDGIALGEADTQVPQEEKIVYDLTEKFGNFEEIFHNIKPSGLVDTDYVQSIINHDYKQIDKCYFAYYTKPPLSDIIKSLETIYDKWKEER
jgi:hypothetical protein